MKKTLKILAWVLLAAWAPIFLLAHEIIASELQLGKSVPKERSPYPLNIEQGSAVGNKTYGWVHITHKVELGKNGLYRYHFNFRSRTGLDVRVIWDVMEGERVDNTIKMERGLSSGFGYDSKYPPVWKLARIMMEVETGKGWRKVGQWWQRGPVPAERD